MKSFLIFNGILAIILLIAAAVCMFFGINALFDGEWLKACAFFLGYLAFRNSAGSPSKE